MKVKKIGEIPKPPEPEIEKEKIKNLYKIPEYAETESDSNFQKSDSSKSSLKKMYYLFGGVIIFILVLVFIYFLFLKKDDISNTNTIISNKDSVNKELALKEKELEIREKELNQNRDNKKPSGYTEASDQIRKWINFFGQQDFKSAYNMLSPNIRGSFSKFSSKSSYGGITSTTVFSCETVYSSGCTFEVIAEYESIDPEHRNGKYKQRFLLNNCDGTWVITLKENLNIEYYN